jgi:catechol 2,3-dioxygenase-like lactoylglutathione lyase family enzyme
MVIQRLNHAVLYVLDAAKSAEFYGRVLGFKEVANLDDRAIFLQASGSANDHDLGLFSVGEGAATAVRVKQPWACLTSRGKSTHSRGRATT